MDTTRGERLEAALRYARAIIEGYQMDLRSQDLRDFIPALISEVDPVYLADVGFCQGSIYLDALDDLWRMANGGTCER